MTYFEINNLDIVISCHCDHHRMINVVSNYGNIDNIAVDPLSKQDYNKILKASINKVNSETEPYAKVRN